jgi:hypothetical protein
LSTPLPSSIRATCPAHLILLDFKLHSVKTYNNIWVKPTLNIWNLFFSPALPKSLYGCLSVNQVRSDCPILNRALWIWLCAKMGLTVLELEERFVLCWMNWNWMENLCFMYTVCSVYIACSLVI